MLKNNKYQILTPAGYKNFAGIRKVEKSEYFHIVFNNNMELDCSVEHPFIKNGNKIKANKLSIGDYIDKENNEKQYILNIDLIKKPIKLYDIIEVEDGNIFNTNGIVSHNCSFLSSGRSVIDYMLIEKYKDKYQKDPIERRYSDQLWLWELPQEGRTYVVSADVARGDGGDFSAFHILDSLNLKQVGEFKGKVETSYFANILYAVSSEYNDALLVVENAAQGWAVLDHLRDKKYRNLYYSIKGELALSLNLAQLMRRELDSKYEPVPGWTTSSKTRTIIIENMKKLINSEDIIIQSIRTLSELDNFVWTTSGKQEAESGHNDDLVLSLAIGLWVREISFKLKIEGVSLTKAILGNIKTTSNAGLYNRNSINDPYVESYKGAAIDLREWLG